MEIKNKYEIDPTLEQWELVLQKLSKLEISFDVLVDLINQKEVDNKQVLDFLNGIINKLVMTGELRSLLALVLTEKGKEFNHDNLEIIQNDLKKLKPNQIVEIFKDFFSFITESLMTSFQSFNDYIEKSKSVPQP